MPNLKLTHLVFLFIFFLIPLGEVFAQTYTISGKVTDAQSNAGMPFVNVYFKGTLSGTSTNFDGFYELSTENRFDSLVVSYLGYSREAVKIKYGEDQTINIKLDQLSIGLGEVEVNAGKNPAIAIVKAVIEKKPFYNKASLKTYEYESYNKMQLSIDNVSDKFKSRWVFKPIKHLFDSLQNIPGLESEAVLPFYNSESLSKIYKESEGNNQKEVIEAVKLSGVGIREGDFISNFTGSSYLDLNFYENKVLLLEKEFLSPLAEGAFIFYEFYLSDSMFIGNDWCYKIKVKPRNDQDLAFFGYMWVTDSTWALKQIDFKIKKSVNINFIETAILQQEFQFTDLGPVFPTKTRIVVDFVDVSNKWVGIIGKIYLSVKDLKINQAYEDDFFKKKIVRADSVPANVDSFWLDRRHEQVSGDDLRVYRLIDSVNTIPMVRNLVSLAYFTLTGYHEIGNIDLGSWHQLISLNVVEGVRIQTGFRTNEFFSDKLRFEGFGAIGTKDEKFKYLARTSYLLDADPYTSISLERRDDLSRGGVSFNYGTIGILGTSQNTVSEDSATNLKYGRINRKIENRLKFEKTFSQGLKTDFTFQNINYIPISPGKLAFRTSEINFYARLNPGAIYLRNDNRAVRVSNRKAPVFTLNAVKGVSGIMKSEFDYFRMNLGLEYRLRLGLLGYSQISLRGDKIFSTVPYPLLGVHRGNQTPFFSRNSFALMNYFEFLSDEYVELTWDHHFGGLFLNRIPLLKKLRLREVIWAHGVLGNLSDNNIEFNQQGDFGTLGNRPYLETGFGVENFLYFFRVDAIYRLTYIDGAYKDEYAIRNPGGTISNFGIKFSISFSL